MSVIPRWVLGRLQQAAPTDAETGGQAGPSDNLLVARAQAGDLRAFDSLVERYRGKIYAIIVNLIKDSAESWDLAQDVFLKAWKALPKFEARSQFYTWLYRIAHNVVYDWMRKRKSRGPHVEETAIRQDNIEAGARTAPREAIQPDAQAERGELRERLDAALAQISEDHRTAILLKEVQGLKYHEIADVMGCSIGTVMSRLFYARKKLQEILKRNEE
ncbi:MAG: sigma-70 family RNA polymerase sigma factor [Verrucomicrobiota bacterium]